MRAYQMPSSAMPHFIRLSGNMIASAARGNGRLCILTYHRILDAHDFSLVKMDVETFRWQMQLLADCFNVLPLHEALQMLLLKQIPPRAVCITFDDGYRSTYDLALPILKEFGLPATVFTTTAHMDGGNMWNDRIIEAVRLLPNGPLDLRELGLDLHPIVDARNRIEIAAKLNDHAKYLLPSERTNVIDTLEKLAGELAGKPVAPNLMLNREMIASLSQNGMEIGGHTVTHPILSKLDDASARSEILENKQVLERIIGKSLRLFAYPNGKVGVDYDERHVRMVEEAGYTAAFTTAIGSASQFNDIYQMPRSRPWDATPFMFGLRLLRWLADRDTAS
ncbi:MAG TPA: polysaccharide deacetylase family protein [Herbaspirillum sp.]|nr:polysaccharide deacetylase family protein [Herbaspirillum sp.]